jgi:hypothetical protein
MSYSTARVTTPSRQAITLPFLQPVSAVTFSATEKPLYIWPSAY